MSSKGVCWDGTSQIWRRRRWWPWWKMVFEGFGYLGWDSEHFGAFSGPELQRPPVFSSSPLLCVWIAVIFFLSSRFLKSHTHPSNCWSHLPFKCFWNIHPQQNSLPMFSGSNWSTRSWPCTLGPISRSLWLEVLKAHCHWLRIEPHWIREFCSLVQSDELLATKISTR